jgi:hypothetical protein
MQSADFGDWVTYTDHLAAVQQAERRGYDRAAQTYLDAAQRTDLYTQGQRDERAAAVQRVEALPFWHDEVLAPEAWVSRDAATDDVLANGGAVSLTFPDGSRLEVVDGVGTFTRPDGTTETVDITGLRFGPSAAYADKVTDELRRRRRARITDADYARAAAIYRLAVVEGEPVQAAVRYVYDVDDPADAITALRHGQRPTLTTSGASKLIAECVRRGLLPATTKGKRSPITTTDGGTA